MSTLKTVSVAHPSSATTNITLDSSGNAAVGGSSLTVGGVAVPAVSPGTTGNVLTSNGSTWTSSAPATSVINTQTFNSSGTWTKPAGYSASSRVMIQVWGGGGSGGKGDATYGAGGGGGGGYNERWMTLSELGATETVTVGAGGAGRTTASSGATGGTTSLGTLVFAYGGGAGEGAAVTPYGGSGGGQLSAGSGGSNARPGAPYILVYTDGTANWVFQGTGGTNQAGPFGTVNYIDSYFHGGGGAVNNASYSAAAKSVWGGGGGGASNSNTAGGVSSYGGSGGAGGNTTSGTAGSQPGGGGGGTKTGATSGAGGAGRIIITVFPA